MTKDILKLIEFYSKDLCYKPEWEENIGFSAKSAYDLLLFLLTVSWLLCDFNQNLIFFVTDYLCFCSTEVAIGMHTENFFIYGKFVLKRWKFMVCSCALTEFRFWDNTCWNNIELLIDSVSKNSFVLSLNGSGKGFSLCNEEEGGGVCKIDETVICVIDGSISANLIFDDREYLLGSFEEWIKIPLIEVFIDEIIIVEIELITI